MSDERAGATPKGGADGATLMKTGGVALFIQRPILSMVISLLIILAGLAALLGVEVRELPDVDQPVVTITTNYDGATPEAIDAEVTATVESGVSQVDGVQSISSTSRFGRSRVVAEFSTSVDINIAATDVKNAVSSLARRFPDGAEEPEVVKADTESDPIMRLAVSTDEITDDELALLIDDIVLPRLQTVDGVAQAYDYGTRRRVIRVRLLPTALAARGLDISDVSNVIAGATRSTPSGRLRNQSQEILIRAEATVKTPEAVGALRLGPRTTLSDVAVVEWGYEDATTTARVDGKPGVGIGILRQAQSNTVAVSEGVREAVIDLRRVLPDHVEVRVTTDDSIFINQAIIEVVRSLALSTAIVVIVIFLFLRSVRATLIPTVTIPISLLGTVAALWLAGFSINILTLLALVMATGLVVDDAIVVTENIERWKAKGAGKRAAAILGTREIVFAVLSTTVTLAAVFIPISFLPGQAGKLFSEFGFVLAFAVMVSSFVALTLAPMLTVKLGGSHVAGQAIDHGAPSVDDPAPLGWLGAVYQAGLRLFLRRRLLSFALSSVFAVGGVLAFNATPSELTPKEDRGRNFMVVTPQDGANFNFLDGKVRDLENAFLELKEEGLVETVVSINGVGGANRSFVVLLMPDWSERSFSQDTLTARSRRILSSTPGISAFVTGGNSLGIRGAGQGLKFAVTGGVGAEAEAAARTLINALSESPSFSIVRPDFSASKPQVSIDVDRETASLLGVDPDAVTLTINAMADEVLAGEVFEDDNSIEILLSGGGDPVDDPTDLANLFVRTGSGAFIPLSSVASIREEAVAEVLTREERRRAAPVTANMAPGVTLSEAAATLEETAKTVLPEGFATILLGEAKVLAQSENATLLVFAFAGVIVFLVLSAQFESFVSAVVIMATAPFGLAAAIYAINLTGGSINYFSQIGLVLLIGVMAKNGILIVEFANQLRDRGMSVRDAAEAAAMTRLRPVLMTGLSTLLGGLPLILGSGAGAESRSALGWVVVGGLGFATLFTLFLTPVAFSLLAGLSRARSDETAAAEIELADASRLQ